jgi:hypothetical protein
VQKNKKQRVKWRNTLAAIPIENPVIVPFIKKIARKMQ